MFDQQLIDFGRKPNVIRDLSAYAGKRKQEIGSENVFDFSIGSPNVPAPPQVHAAMLDLLQNGGNRVSAENLSALQEWYEGFCE